MKLLHHIFDKLKKNKLKVINTNTSPDKIDIIVLSIAKTNDGQKNLEVLVLTLWP